MRLLFTFITVYGIDCTMEFRAVYKGGADWRDKTPDENTLKIEVFKKIIKGFY